MIERIGQLVDRLGGYAWWQVLLEIGVIWLGVYAVARFVRGTRAAGAIKGLLVLSVATILAVALVGQTNLFPRLTILIQWFLVFLPFVGTPHGVTGCRPPDVRPSPPPWGWSTGFIATPRTLGRRPNHRLRPALPMDTFS